MGGKQERGVSADGLKISFVGDKIALKLDSDDDCTALKKNTQLYALKAWILCYVNSPSKKLSFKNTIGNK